VSSDDARSAAQRLLTESAARIALLDIRKLKTSRQTDYAYGVSGVPEEVIGDATEVAGITRNRLGCLVLNVARVMFVDIDLPRYSLLAKLFRKPTPETTFLATLDNWVDQHRDVHVRVYRTAGGLRYLFSHAWIEPDEKALTWMRELGCDPLYARLCKSQACFRARLSPKPWRMGVAPLTSFYPRETSASQNAFRSWLAAYEQRAQGFSTCTFVKSVGSGSESEDLSAIVQQHDSATKAHSSLPLA
jgi:hypothetical protein